MAFFRQLLGRRCLPFPYSGQPGKGQKQYHPDAGVLSRPGAGVPYGRDPYGNYLQRAPITTTMSLSIRPAAWIAASIARLDVLRGIRQLLLAIEIEYVRKEGLRKLFLAPFPFWPCTTRRSSM